MLSAVELLLLPLLLLQLASSASVPFSGDGIEL
jgi:hypothetical protein